VDDFTRPGHNLEGYTTDYVKRLLIERLYIYAKLYNPGGSVILRASDIVDHDRPVGYSTEIGNVFHLDLIELDREFQRLVEEKHCSKKEIQALMTWADGLTAKQAADYMHTRGAVSVRKLRSRGLRKLQERMEHGTGEKPRGTGDRHIGTRRKETQDDVVQERHHRQPQEGDDREAGASAVTSDETKGVVNANSI